MIRRGIRTVRSTPRRGRGAVAVVYNQQQSRYLATTTCHTRSWTCPGCARGREAVQVQSSLGPESVVGPAGACVPGQVHRAVSSSYPDLPPTRRPLRVTQKMHVALEGMGIQRPIPIHHKWARGPDVVWDPQLPHASSPNESCTILLVITPHEKLTVPILSSGWLGLCGLDKGCREALTRNISIWLWRISHVPGWWATLHHKILMINLPVIIKAYLTTMMDNSVKNETAPPNQSNHPNLIFFLFKLWLNWCKKLKRFTN